MSVFDEVKTGLQKIFVDVCCPIEQVIDEEEYLQSNGYICTGQIGGGEPPSYMIFELIIAETIKKAAEHEAFCKGYWQGKITEGNGNEKMSSYND